MTQLGATNPPPMEAQRLPTTVSNFHQDHSFHGSLLSVQLEGVMVVIWK